MNDGDELLEGLEPEALLRACEGMVRSCRRRCPQTVRAFGLGILGIFMWFFLIFHDSSTFLHDCSCFFDVFSHGFRMF